MLVAPLSHNNPISAYMLIRVGIGFSLHIYTFSSNNARDYFNKSYGCHYSHSPRCIGDAGIHYFVIKQRHEATCDLFRT